MMRCRLSDRARLQTVVHKGSLESRKHCPTQSHHGESWLSILAVMFAHLIGSVSVASCLDQNTDDTQKGISEIWGALVAGPCTPISERNPYQLPDNVCINRNGE